MPVGDRQQGGGILGSKIQSKVEHVGGKYLLPRGGNTPKSQNRSDTPRNNMDIVAENGELRS